MDILFSHWMGEKFPYIKASCFVGNYDILVVSAMHRSSTSMYTGATGWSHGDEERCVISRSSQAHACIEQDIPECRYCMLVRMGKVQTWKLLYAAILICMAFCGVFARRVPHVT